jgi:hypothetical protein
MSQSASVSESPPSTNRSAGPISPDPDFEVRWAAWKARSAAHDRMIRRRLAIAAAALTIPAAILYGLRLL